jgi:acyl dehydratase
VVVQSTADEDYGARITEEGLVAAKARIGVEVPHRLQDTSNAFATSDSIRAYSHSIGDPNPLFCDPEYAHNTRWRDVIAHPTMIPNTMGVSEIDEIPPEIRAKGAHALAGVHGWYSADDCEWLRAVYSGDKLTVRHWATGVELKQSRFAGRLVKTNQQYAYINQRGELVCLIDQLVFYGERLSAGASDKYKEIERTIYTPESLEQIASDYEREQARGAEPRYWEDVSEGEELTPVVKGPLTVTDMLAFVKGGYSPFVRTGKLRYEYQKCHPRALLMNKWNIPDVVERVHWDDDLASAIGAGWAYDYGAQRFAWLSHVVTNWVGDDGWLWKQKDQFRLFVYVGDTLWIKGHVTGKFQDDQHNCAVELDIWAEDQRGRITASGTATALLPSREHGPVMLPPRRPSAEFEGQRPQWATQLH